LQHIVQIRLNLSHLSTSFWTPDKKNDAGCCPSHWRTTDCNSVSDATFCLPSTTLLCYCWSRKTLVAIHWTHLRVNLISIKSFCPQKKTNSSTLFVTGRLQRQRGNVLYLMFIS